jgi:hypothetical protein
MITVASNAAGARPENPYFTVTVDRHGTFRIDDVPAGSYSLGVRFQQNDAGHLRDYRFTVPPTKGDLAEQPIDLGVLTLVKP